MLSGALRWCCRYLIVGAVCTLIGVVGYQMYGSEVMEEVTLNLPSGALAMLATALIVVNPFTKVRTRDRPQNLIQTP